MKEALIFNLFPIFLINLFLKRNYSFLYLFSLVDCFFHLPFDHGYISGHDSKYWFNFAKFFDSFYLKHQMCVILQNYVDGYIENIPKSSPPHFTGKDQFIPVLEYLRNLNSLRKLDMVLDT